MIVIIIGQAQVDDLFQYGCCHQAQFCVRLLFKAANSTAASSSSSFPFFALRFVFNNSNFVALQAVLRIAFDSNNPRER